MREMFFKIATFCILLFRVISAHNDDPGLYDKMSCFLFQSWYGYECCQKASANFRYEAFNETYHSSLHGQDSVIQLLARVVSDQWDKTKIPKRALVLSLHGPTGTGKTYISEILAKYTYLKSKESSFYHYFSSGYHFPNKDEKSVAIYKALLSARIRESVSKCERSLFVFDDAANLPVLLLDVLKPFVDFQGVIDGVDYTRSIFILLSDIGGQVIVKKLTDWKRQGRSRSSFPIQELEQEVIRRANTDESGGLKDSALLKYQLISHFIPFLPLERRHVVRCIKDCLREVGRRDLTDDRNFIERVLAEIPFVPDKEKFFSRYGCKRVYDKVIEALEAFGKPPKGEL